MKKQILLLFVLLIFGLKVHSQTGQFAVVKPNGMSQVFSTWASAYAGAVDGDFIYLPGIEISGTITIDKQLHIYGAGHHPDSTTATGETVMTGPLNILGHASNGSIEGIKINSATVVGGNYKLNAYTIKRCFFKGISFSSSTSDSLPENILVTESIITYAPTGSTGFSGGNSDNNLFTKNIFYYYLTNFKYSTFKNNIFLSSNPANNIFVLNNITHCNIDNNIFIVSDPSSFSAGNCYNTYVNNLKITNPDFLGSELCPASQANNVFVPNIDDIFITLIGVGHSYNYVNDYHLKPTCPGVGAGTDGTDVGIYGTINPTVEGWIPSNPHIFFKQVDPETGPDGKLHIQVGVRANNN